MEIYIHSTIQQQRDDGDMSGSPRRYAHLGGNSFNNIKIVGVGGFGCNVISALTRKALKDVELIAMNTDAQALKSSPAIRKLQIGMHVTKGHGANGCAKVGRMAALESFKQVRAAVMGSDIVFIIAGMGGGTGSGAAPVIASIARESGALPVGIVSAPFGFEGHQRTSVSKQYLSYLYREIAVITISNQMLLELYGSGIPIADFFSGIEEMLCSVLKGFMALIASCADATKLSDIKQIISVKGAALVGVGMGAGKTAAMDATYSAINSRLSEYSSIAAAGGILVNITGGQRLSLDEVNIISDIITNVASKNAKIVTGTAITESWGDRMEVVLIATGLNHG